MFRKLLVISLLTIFSLTNCGGGGGGDDPLDFVGAATVDLRNQPHRIDPGNHTRVQVKVSDVHKNGIALKVRFPVGLLYVPDSAELTVDSVNKDMNPDVNASDNNYVYLVWYMDQSLFGPNGEKSGSLVFELRGVSEVDDGNIEAMVSVLDPHLPDGTGFDINNPNFSAQTDDYITVNSPS
ncbi:MAG: hypothetical protein GYA55_12105 [SAR324 cluster bacterium]|uniref:Cohesin domain-containing protein n=1 Tax=SAR324 cluster bacterium TaxID=2024889 RepID=A0A7X9IL55_9DELT|nr:hypothetical protein [SAR324 cluster bacterium]